MVGTHSSVEVIEDTLHDIDLGFNKLQTNFPFFICEIIFSGYLLLNLALIAEKFLMPSLMNISKRYGMS